MARTLALVVLAAALTLPATLSAATATDGTLSVKRGHGIVLLKFTGTAIGRLAQGKVRIIDKKPFDANSPVFRHCRVRYLSATTTLCTGRRLSFRATDGRYVVRVQGGGMYLSAVGRGTVMVDGVGDQGLPDGVMSIDDGPYQSLPDAPMTFDLGTPPTQR